MLSPMFTGVPSPSTRPSPDDLIRSYAPVARSIASRYRNRGLDLDDLEQVALLGLVKAARGFDPDAGHDFMSYAVPTVRGEVRRHFRDHGWMVRPPRRVQELQFRIGIAREELTAETGRSPRPSEIAIRADEPLADVIEALAADGCFRPASLDAPASEAGSGLGELLGDHDREFDRTEARLVLGPALHSLGERDRRIVQLRYYEERTQQEIADVLGMTQTQVSRVLKRILAELRDGLEQQAPAA